MEQGFECLADFVGMSFTKFRTEVGERFLFTDRERAFLEGLANMPLRPHPAPVAKRQKTNTSQCPAPACDSDILENIATMVYKAADSFYRVKDTLPRNPRVCMSVSCQG